MVELQRTIRRNPKALILSFDLEAYEHNHSIILEIGYAMTTLNNQEDVQTFHYIIQENLRYVRTFAGFRKGLLTRLMKTKTRHFPADFYIH